MQGKISFIEFSKKVLVPEDLFVFFVSLLKNDTKTYGEWVDYFKGEGFSKFKKNK